MMDDPNDNEMHRRKGKSKAGARASSIHKDDHSMNEQHQGLQGCERGDSHNSMAFTIPLKRTKVKGKNDDTVQEKIQSKYWGQSSCEANTWSQKRLKPKTQKEHKHNRESSSTSMKLPETTPWVSVQKRTPRKIEKHELALEKVNDVIDLRPIPRKSPSQKKTSNKSEKTVRKPRNSTKPQISPSDSRKQVQKSEKSEKLQVKHKKTMKQGQTAGKSSKEALISGKFAKTVTHMAGMLHKEENICKQQTDEPLEIGDDSDSESDWEEVAEMPLFKPEVKDKCQIPDDPVEITLESPDIMKKKKTKGSDPNDWIRLQMNKVKKESQMNVHKVHLLCLLAEGVETSRACNDAFLQAMMLSLVPAHLLTPISIWQRNDLSKLLKWFVERYPVCKTLRKKSSQLAQCLQSRLDVKMVASYLELVMVFVVLCRAIGLEARFVRSLQPTSSKAADLVLKTVKSPAKPEVVCLDTDSDTNSSKPEGKTLANKLSSLMNNSPNRHFTSKQQAKQETKRAQSVNTTRKQTKSSNSRNTPKNERQRKRDSKVSYSQGTSSDICESRPGGQLLALRDALGAEIDQERQLVCVDSSSDEEPVDELMMSSSKSASDEGFDYWSEVFLEREDTWICVDCVKARVNCPKKLGSRATQPVCYILGFSNRGPIKDVTKRYAPDYISQTRKLRVDEEWWGDTLAPYGPKTLADMERDHTENSMLQIRLMQEPFPKSISEFKNHPFYALTRHLLKFEALYPDTAVPVGYIKSEPIYARECIRGLHSRDHWLKEGRSVKIDEEAYKTVKSRKKKSAFDPATEELITPLYGRWQTEEYKPPPVLNGVVPRNEYGNLEIFKPSMLPSGAVHIKLSGIQKLAKKLEIDFAPAMVGWEQHGNFAHPLVDGIVVCKEYKEILYAAWQEDEMIRLQKELDKRQKRVLDNWTRLVKGLFLRERMKEKFQLQEPEKPRENKTGDKSDTNSSKTDIANLSWPQNRTSPASTSRKPSKDASTPFPFEMEQF